ncbi:innexin inx2-like [Toxorhynchites rutilus septentrionalis]|uniref:innexin inx2-like n=1 Tax=Toxorhynchites rutilus septentrionalis TaxID=329112 RepID=UPI002478B66B|nr:innexin inx2-like [Toxorhynchites rutilus septentrionalis]
MIEFASYLRQLLKSNGIDSTNAVWRLHSRATVYSLAFFTVLLSARSYFGDPINCITTATGTVQTSMNSYCWTLGTYISKDPKFVFSNWDVIQIGHKMGHIPVEERTYQKYYQWVAFLLGAQAVLFSIPKHIWRCYERNRIATLSQDLTSILHPIEWTDERKSATLFYLTHESRSRHTTYAVLFFICELLNFLVVLINMFLLNFILGGFWGYYAPAIRSLLSLDMNAWISYNSLVFPKLAKCDFHYIGASGSEQTVDALCLLPQNIVNEKIFAFLWLWFIVLAIISGAQVCYRITQLCSPRIRLHLLYAELHPINYSRLKLVNQKACIGFWFLLYQMARNVNKNVMREIMKELSTTYREQELSKQTLIDDFPKFAMNDLQNERNGRVQEDDEVTV